MRPAKEFMTFRVERDLRDAFLKAAQGQHVPGSQVLRQMMRDYVAQHRPSVEPAPLSIGAKKKGKTK